MGNHEIATVEDEMTRERFDEAGNGVALSCRKRLELGNGFVETVSDLNLSPAEPTGKLIVVIAADREGVALDGHVENDRKYIKDGWAAVYQIPEEDGFAACWMDPGFRAPGFGIYGDRSPSQLCQQKAEFSGTAVNIANDVVGSWRRVYQRFIMAVERRGWL